MSDFDNRQGSGQAAQRRYQGEPQLDAGQEGTAQQPREAQQSGDAQQSHLVGTDSQATGSSKAASSTPEPQMPLAGSSAPESRIPQASDRTLPQVMGSHSQPANASQSASASQPANPGQPSNSAQSANPAQPENPAQPQSTRDYASSYSRPAEYATRNEYRWVPPYQPAGEGQGNAYAQQGAYSWAEPQPQPKRKGPGWMALIAATVIAALLGATLGVGTMQMRWSNARPASIPSSSTAGATKVVDTDGTTPDWQKVAEAVGNAVVSINVTTQKGSAAGSGFVIDSDGHIVTNDHVVSDATDTLVTLSDGRVYKADIVGTDDATDLAVIKLDSPPDDLTTATLGDSSDLVVGQPVAAIGNPLGLSSTMTTGIISALDRPVRTVKEGVTPADSTQVITNAIQIDAAVNPGNSGGPVFDAAGRVIGVASSIATLGEEGASGSIGLGFAIPVDLAKRVADEIIANGVAEHAYLGVTIVDGFGQAKGTTWKGAEVRTVEPNTPAGKANLRQGDVIVKANGRDVTSASSLTGYVRQQATGDTMTLTIVRSGEVLDVDVTLAARPD